MVGLELSSTAARLDVVGLIHCATVPPLIDIIHINGIE